jgi:multidrug efflux pump subunit AcrA (membrane-fusion protein)
VDNKALRFTPNSKLFEEYMKTNPQAAKAKIEHLLSVSSKTKDATAGNTKKPTILWVKKGTEINPVKVETGLSDDTNTEIKSGVSAGDEVIFAMQSPSANITGSKGTVKSPFMPTRPGARTPAKK